MNRLAKTLALAAPLVAAMSLASNSADACGGCFIQPSENTVVSGHRMALSVSMQRTVLWDQIQYQGNPEDFSWVLPIKPGARIELADNGWFEALEASTLTTISAPPLQCTNGQSTFGCGDSGGFASSLAADGATGGFEDGPNGVTVVKQETVGPYDSVTLSSENANALTEWLESHNYEIPDDVLPVIAAYVEDGFDFIALRLTPGNGVNLMAPVRVITDGASPVLPLRMVAAGTGPLTSIILYVIGEGRWTTDNFPEVAIPYDDLVWDGAKSDSNYAELRSTALSSNQGRSWISVYAQNDAFFDANWEENAGGYIANTYINTLLDDAGSNYDEIWACQEDARNAGTQGGIVVDPCDPVTGMCADQVGLGEIDARDFTCGDLSDLSVALVGMHPQDVWVTRLEANLPRQALGEDLALRAHDTQATVTNYHVTPNTENYECPAVPPDGPSGKKGVPGNHVPFVLAGLGALAALLVARRRPFVRA